MKISFLLFALLLGAARLAHADYDGLEQELQDQQAQNAAAQEQAEERRDIAAFNAKITGMVMAFGRAHGFRGGVPQPEMNPLIPGRILKFEFSTKDNYECRAEPGDLSFYAGKSEDNPAILSCIQEGTLKQLFLGR